MRRKVNSHGASTLLQWLEEHPDCLRIACTFPMGYLNIMLLMAALKPCLQSPPGWEQFVHCFTCFPFSVVKDLFGVGWLIFTALLVSQFVFLS